MLESSNVSVDHARLPSSAPTAAQPGFAALGLPQPVIGALHRQRITTPTPVQAAVIPDALAGSDVLARARTGSGKTLAFGLPMLVKLAGRRSKPRSPRGLIVLPTRELALQVHAALEPLAAALRLKLVTVYGGTPYDRQIRRLRDGADIVVATPGRLEDLIDKGACHLGAVEVSVLDEADHLCDLGFFPVMSRLLTQTPEHGQRLLLSATLDKDVDKLVRRHLRNPVVHELDPDQGAVTTMDHHVLVVEAPRKLAATRDLLDANPRSMVFTRTRRGATRLAKSLTAQGHRAVELHGDLSQGARERNLASFRTGRARTVVATDVAARGIHVDAVSLVVHFDVPPAAKSYLHRSGRTARAGESGAVVTMSSAEQVGEVVRMQTSAGVDARHHDVDTVPRPMTAAALATSGTAAPRTPAPARASNAGRRRSRSRGPVSAARRPVRRSA
jgi:superfamily II DNA/RNA helicase